MNDKKQQILAAAVSLARSHGYKGVTREAVAARAQVAAGLVNRYFGTMDLLRSAVITDALTHGALAVVAQGLAHKDPVALAAPVEIRSAAVAFVGGDL